MTILKAVHWPFIWVKETSTDHNHMIWEARYWAQPNYGNLIGRTALVVGEAVAKWEKSWL